jgi:hypothetical protein
VTVVVVVVMVVMIMATFGEKERDSRLEGKYNKWCEMCAEASNFTCFMFWFGLTGSNSFLPNFARELKQSLVHMKKNLLSLAAAYNKTLQKSSSALNATRL